MKISLNYRALRHFRLGLSGKKADSKEYELPVIHRNEMLDEEGISQVVVERFITYRLPFLLQVKEEMDEGRILTDGELELMSRFLDRSDRLSTFVYQHPQFKELIAKIIDLMHDIMDEALRNQTKHDQ